jgi:hypothetical protein
MITLETGINYLGLDASNVDDVSLVEDLINELTLYIENYLKTTILVKDVTKYIKGDGFSFISLFAYKVNSITTIKYRETAFDTWKTIANTDYVLTYTNNYNRLVFKDDMKIGYEYEIKSNQGVDIANVPYDLQKAFKEMLYLAYRNKTKDVLGKSNVGDSAVGVSLNTTYIDLTPVWLRTLNNYRYYQISEFN